MPAGGPRARRVMPRSRRPTRRTPLPLSKKNLLLLFLPLCCQPTRPPARVRGTPPGASRRSSRRRSRRRSARSDAATSRSGGTGRPALFNGARRRPLVEAEEGDFLEGEEGETEARTGAPTMRAPMGPARPSPESSLRTTPLPAFSAFLKRSSLPLLLSKKIRKPFVCSSIRSAPSSSTHGAR